MKIILLILIFAQISSIEAQHTLNEELLTYVKSQTNDYATLEELHRFLIKPAKNKREESVLFFYWIAENIEYDILKADKIENSEKVESVDVLMAKKGVCSDYSELFKSFCDLSGIECYFISGYSKEYPSVTNKSLKIDHAWNVIKLDNNFEFVDCTWGSGSVGQDKNGNPQYFKNMDISYLFDNTDKFRTFHLPAIPMWQLLEYPVSYEHFVDHLTYAEMHQSLGAKYNFRDSIEAFNTLPIESKKINEMVKRYYFHPVYKNAFECGRNYEILAYSLTKGDFDEVQINQAISYYDTSKTWYVKAFKMANEKSGKVDRSHIEFIKNVNKRIKYCKYRLLTRT